MEKKIGRVTLRSSTKANQSSKEGIPSHNMDRRDRVARLVVRFSGLLGLCGALLIFGSLLGDMVSREGSEFLGGLFLAWPIFFPLVIFPFCLPPMLLSAAIKVKSNAAAVILTLAAGVSQVLSFRLSTSLEDGRCPYGAGACIALNDLVVQMYIASRVIAFGIMIFLGTRSEKIRKERLKNSELEIDD